VEDQLKATGVNLAGIMGDSVADPEGFVGGEESGPKEDGDGNGAGPVYA